jgi:hypothetical protein
MDGWREEWETTGYVDDVATEGDRYRVRIRTERGDVVRYTVQYEVLFEGRFYPVIRYDSAHGRPHLDILGWEGESVDKQWLADEPLAEAATAAIIDVKTNWWLHRERFMRRKS